MESMLDDDGYRIRSGRDPGREVGADGDDRPPHHQLDGDRHDDNYTGAAGVGLGVMDKGTINPLHGILPGTRSSGGVLSDSNDWYLFADPADVPAFALGFLNGNEQPFVGPQGPAGAQRDRGGHGPVHLRARHGRLQGAPRLRRGGGRSAGRSPEEQLQRESVLAQAEADDQILSIRRAAAARVEEARREADEWAATQLAQMNEGDGESGSGEGTSGLDGNVAEASEYVAGLDSEALDAAEAEEKGKPKPRAGVLKAIESRREALAAEEPEGDGEGESESE
jgi:hypothetical protein